MPLKSGTHGVIHAPAIPRFLSFGVPQQPDTGCWMYYDVLDDPPKKAILMGKWNGDVHKTGPSCARWNKRRRNHLWWQSKWLIDAHFFQWKIIIYICRRRISYSTWAVSVDMLDLQRMEWLFLICHVLFHAMVPAQTRFWLNSDC